MSDVLEYVRIEEPVGPLEEIDFFSPEVLSNPMGYLQRARRESPIVDCKVTELQRVRYLVTTHELVGYVLTNPSLFSSNYIAILKGRAKDDPEVERIRATGFEEIDSLLTSDDRAHKRIRSLVGSAFVPKRIRAMEETLKNVVGELITDMRTKDRVDFIRDFANYLPANALAYLMGVGKEDHDAICRYSEAIIRRFGLMGTLDERIADETTIVEAKAFMERLVAKRRANPGDDLVSDLIAARDEDGEALSELEILANIFILFVGATDTTFSSLISAMAHLLINPEMAEHLRNNPQDIPLFTEEVIRFYPPASGFWRVVREDLELGGKQMKKGDVIMVRVDSANRDPGQFENPNSFDIYRTNNNRNFSFSGGAHSCLGFRLAKMEMNLAIEALVNLPTPPRLDEVLSDLSTRPSTHVKCIKELHLCFDRVQA